MKRSLYYFVLFLMLLSCGKAKDFYSDLGKGVYLTFVSSKTLLNGTDPSAAIQLVVNATGEAPQSINIYVTATATTDKSKWKLLKNFPYSGQTTLTATNAQVATALGLTAGSLPPGAVYNLYNEVVTKDGHQYSSANTSAADLENQIGFNTAMKWTATVVCPYDASTVAGNYTVVQDDWQDWAPGDVVTVTAGPGNNQINLSQVWPNPANAAIVTPLVISVDPLTGVVTVPANITFGDYGNAKAITIDGSGFVFSCKKKISIRVHITAPPFGDQGFSQLILQQ